MGIRRITATLAALAAAVVLAAPVQAAPLVREHYSGTDSGSFDDCGFVIDFDATFSGLFMLKKGRHGDPTPYLSDNYRSHVLYSSGDNWFTVDANGLYKDLRIKNVTGTIYTFEAMEVGRPFVVRDMHGNRIVHDRGRLLYRFVVDTLGDDNLDNDVFVDGSFEVLADKGSHPGFYLDFCELASDLLL